MRNITAKNIKNQCFGSGFGSSRIRIIWPDPDPIQETYKNIIFKKRNHPFCLININNKVINYKKKHRIKSYTEKNIEKKLKFIRF